MLVVVAGARGGIGTTTLAVGLAGELGAVLVDTDGPAGGVDVWLGAEDVPGVRWSGLGLAGGDLAAADLSTALPRADGVRVLAADRADLPRPEPFAQVLEVLAGTPVVVDLARRVDAVAAAAVARADLAVVVVPAGVPGVASAHVLVGALLAHSPGAALGLLVTGRDLPPAEVAAAVGAPVLAAVAGPTGIARVVPGLADGLGAGR